MNTKRPSVAIVHDYLTQRGGAERVVLAMAQAFPDAVIHTSLYDPDSTYPEFKHHDIRTSVLQRAGLLRRHHRLALPFYASIFSRMNVTADVVICSTSGWAHGARVRGKKLVYCYTPARWLYCMDDYLGTGRLLWRLALIAFRPMLLSWDKASLSSINRTITSSNTVKERIRLAWGIDASILAPPVSIDPSLPRSAPPYRLPSEYLLVVSRLLPYKGIDSIIDAVRLTDLELVIVGDGPDSRRLHDRAGPRVHFLPTVSDAQLRHLYHNCLALVAASTEDFGLTPLEANAFGKPAVVLSAGGFIDTISEGLNGLFFDSCSPTEIAHALEALRRHRWDPERIRAHADQYAIGRFISQLRALVDEMHVELV